MEEAVERLIGKFSGPKIWNNLRGITTLRGDFDAVYDPGPVEKVYIRHPNGTTGVVSTPGLADFRLTVQDGMIVVRWLKIVGDGKELRLTTTAMVAGEVAGATVTGTNPAEDSMNAEEVRTIVREEVKPVLNSLDATWSDLRDRLGAIQPGTMGLSQEQMAQIAQLAADRVLLGEAQADHYGLPANAQMGTRFQETIGYMLFDPDFMEAWFLQVGAIIADMKARQVIVPGL
jgi:hypothetical protein